MNQKKMAWITTFGDLLTLLLCFVLVCFFSQVNKQNRKNKQDQYVETSFKDNLAQSAHSGKDFASKKVTVSRHRSWTFSSGEFESISKLQELGQSEASGLIRVDLEICSLKQSCIEELASSIASKVSLEKFNLVLGSEACKNLALFNTEATLKKEILLRIWF